MTVPFVCFWCMAEKNDKIIKYRRPVNFNLGTAIFGVILVYILVILYFYATSKHISGYEVKEGSLAVDTSYTGVVIRTENVYNATDSGYINYYAREGEKVSNGSMVYTIDSSGKLGDMLTAGYETGDALTNADLDELKTQIINYRNNYNDRNFGSVYNFKFSVEGTVLKLANRNVLTSLSEIKDKSILDLVDFEYSTDSGIIVYSTDGLENLTNAEINEDIFVEENHPKNQMQSNALVDTGEPVYKLITEENWAVVFPLEAERYNELTEGDYIKVKFLKTGDESWGKISLFTREGEDESKTQYYCRLDFTNSMITFATDRYLDIELKINPTTGLKIPKSSIVKKDFYLVPKEYLVYGDRTDEEGFMRQALREDGSYSTEFVPASVYYSDDENLYIDMQTLRVNEYLLAPDGNDKFEVGPTTSLIGVYNMNKGFADFSQVTILYENKEYAIVKPNDEYGLSVYDHIVLDGSAVEDDDFVFE